jgi:hypothetical protein
MGKLARSYDERRADHWNRLGKAFPETVGYQPKGKALTEARSKNFAAVAAEPREDWEAFAEEKRKRRLAMMFADEEE